jgi:hypothetical protein
MLYRDYQCGNRGNSNQDARDNRVSYKKGYPAY